MSNQKRLAILNNQSMPGVILVMCLEEDPTAFAQTYTQVSNSPAPFTVSVDHIAENAKELKEKVTKVLDERNLRVSVKEDFFKCDLKMIKRLIEEASKADPVEAGKQPNAIEELVTVPQGPNVTFEEIKLEDYIDLNNCALIDIYYELPKNQKRAHLLLSGFPYSQTKKEKFSQLKNSKVFALKEDIKRISQLEVNDKNAAIILNDSVVKQVNHLHQALLSPKCSNPAVILTAMTEYADKLIDEVGVPTAKLLESFAKNIDLQNDIKAITSISIMLAKAADFQTQTAYKDLTMAVLLMDLSLANISPMILNRYYTRQMLDNADIKEKFKTHPLNSLTVADQRFPHLGETVKNLILFHHERFDGSGYPTGLKGFNIFPLAQVLGLSVEIFEEMKFRSLRKLGMNFFEVFDLVYSQSKEGSRKFSPQLLEKIKVSFAKQKAEAKRAA